MNDGSRSSRLLGYLPLLIAVGGILVGVWQYRETKRAEFRQRFWEAQLALYQDATEAAAAIANARDLDAVADARTRFWQLYWGPLSMIEHPEVERAMIAFGAALGECERGGGACAGGAPGDSITPLRQKAYDLAHCVRASLHRTWHPVDIGDVTRCPYGPPRAALP
jgi:hypothetical protein